MSQINVHVSAITKRKPRKKIITIIIKPNRLNCNCHLFKIYIYINTNIYLLFHLFPPI